MLVLLITGLKRYQDESTTNSIMFISSYIKRRKLVFKALMQQLLSKLCGTLWKSPCSIRFEFTIKFNMRFPCGMQEVAWGAPEPFFFLVRMTCGYKSVSLALHVAKC
jgi:hypothetical protein